MKAIVVRRHGGPEVLEYIDVPTPQTAPDEALVRLHAIGVNRRDAFIREGIYPRALPLTPGIEAAGVIEALGESVSRWHAGTRVVYYVPDRLGAYAEYQSVPVARLVQLPDAMPFEVAAAIFDHGLTAQYLTTSTFALREGHRALVHAGAGGVGSLLVQFAKQAGATVYATASTPEKQDWVRALGADAVIAYRDKDFVEAVRELTQGAGVDVVYDSVGAPTWHGSVRCLKPRGLLVLYGQSGGEVKAIDASLLADAGSVFFTRPHLAHHIATCEELDMRSADLFARWQDGEITFKNIHLYPLAEVAQAHARLADRASFGKIVLQP